MKRFKQCVATLLLMLFLLAVLGPEPHRRHDGAPSDHHLADEPFEPTAPVVADTATDPGSGFTTS